jgi:hypothetical protein
MQLSGFYIFSKEHCFGNFVTPFSKFYKQSVLHMLTLWVIIHHCVVCSSSIYGFWLPLWYILTLLTSNQHCSYVHFTKHLFYRLIFTEASVCIFCREITRPYNSVVNTHIALYSIFFSTSYRGRLDHDHMVVFFVKAKWFTPSVFNEWHVICSE